MSHTYKSEFPAGVTVDSGIAQFFETFYQTSDTPEAHEKYADSFTKDATFILASKTVKGHDEILAARQAMWSAVARRLHRATKIFPFGPNSNEVMLYGTVEYGLKDGRSTVLDWAAHAKLVKVEGHYKLDFYQVYLDTAAVQNAK